jgi:hypothetical protein
MIALPAMAVVEIANALDQAGQLMALWAYTREYLVKRIANRDPSAVIEHGS